MTDNEKCAIVAVLQHLKAAEATKPEAAKAAIASLTDVYGITPQDFSKYAAPDAAAFPEVYMEGRKALAIVDTDADISPGAVSEEDPAFVKFLNRLKGTAFFAGVEEGSDEYARRVSRARAKFANRSKSPTNASPAVPTTSAERAVPSAVSEETKAKANELKLQGNAFLKEKDFEKAKDAYTQCIKLDGNNAIYYGNRAASKMHLAEYSSAVDDCKMAISIDPKYARAHERLASAYKSLGMDDAELEALENAVRIHPGNAQLEKLLQNAKDRKNAPATASGMPGMGGMPSADMLSSMAASMGLPNVSPDMLKSFMNSPMGAQMANAFAQTGAPGAGLNGNPAGENMMDAMKNNPGAMPAAFEALTKNPEMMSRAAEALKDNPELVNEAMKAMLGGGAGGGGGPRPPPPGII